jgi:hypothetical protein
MIAVTMSPDTQGRLTQGSSISILLYPDNLPDAQSSAGFAPTYDTGKNRRDNTLMWDESDQLNITFTNRDSATFTGYDARLYGSSWTL